jgi:hypothetical protein
MALAVLVYNLKQALRVLDNGNLIFFGTPLGLGLATATTSAAFPHLAQRFRLDLTHRAAVTNHTYQELAEAIAQFLMWERMRTCAWC